MSTKKFIKKLPQYFQTETNAKFFDATIDQLYSQKNSKRINAYIGRKSGKAFDPLTDFYKSEPSKERSNYQLEPAVCVTDPVSNKKSDFRSYTDIVNFIKNNNGIVNNHSRVFDTQVYSFGPPVDMDKLINFQDYHWVESPIAVTITGVNDNDIENNLINQPLYTTPSGLVLTSGMMVIFADSTKYNQRLWVEGVGRRIELVPESEVSINVSGARLTYLPWDSIENGISNEEWDLNAWDAIYQSQVEYSTMERGCIDGNGWSRNNRWVHKDAILKTFAANGISANILFPRATRPIIEFKRNIELYNFGKKFAGYVDLALEGFSKAELESLTRVEFENILSTLAEPGNTIILSTDNLVYDISYTGVNENVVLTQSVSFKKYISNGQYDTAIYIAEEKDVVVVKTGLLSGNSFLNEGTQWVKSLSDRQGPKQFPLFNLYDFNKTPLLSYNGSNFNGNEIVSYALDFSGTTPLDPVLQLPVVYQNFGQSSDVLLEFDITKEKYSYVVGNSVEVINGTYLFKSIDNDQEIYESIWTYSDRLVEQTIRQEFLFSGINRFKLDVLPRGVDSTGNISPNTFFEVELNGNLADYIIFSQNNELYVSLTGLVKENDFITIEYFSDIPLPSNSNGFYTIPKSLSNNPYGQDITEKTLSELSDHFRSIIELQDNAVFSLFGESTNYRDTKKDVGRGNVVIQPVGSLVKALQMTYNDINIVDAIEYNKKEYQKFKNKLIHGADKIQRQDVFFNDNFTIDTILQNIVKDINLIRAPLKEFSLTNMVALCDVFESESLEFLGSVQHYNMLGYSKDNNNQQLYIWAKNLSSVESDIVNNIYNTSDDYTLLTENVDYWIRENFIEFKSSLLGLPIEIRKYTDVICFVPVTPSKIGISKTFIPCLFLDTSYSEPTWVILGHDGSKTRAYGKYNNDGTVLEYDLRDAVLLNFEMRIYNGISYKFKDEDYRPLLSLNSVKPSFDNITKFQKSEIDEILFPAFCNWASRNEVNFIDNYTTIDGRWKTYNFQGSEVSGSWKSIYRYYFGTENINTFPWESLGFSIKPLWWDSEYGLPVNGLYNNSFSNMWNDIANGIIRHGNNAGMYQEYKHSLLLTSVPVDSNGELINPSFFISLVETDNNWKFGEESPAEYTWMSSSEYQFDICKLLFLTKPAIFSELFWNTGVYDLYYFERESFYESVNIQLFDSFGLRSNRVAGSVHNEDQNTYKLGYQIWVTDYLLSTNKNIGLSLGNKLRNSSVNLSHRIAGFTSQDSLRLFLQGSTTVGSETLLIPDSNIQILINKSVPVNESVFSGVIIQLTEKKKFKLFGYDTNTYFFEAFSLNTNTTPKYVNSGGTPAPFLNYEVGKLYKVGTIVRYNTIFYQCIQEHDASSFNTSFWSPLSKLPVSGGITVAKYPVTNRIVKVPYTTEFMSIQEVYNFLIGYGELLETKGWNLSEFNEVNNKLKNWQAAAEEFLFWASGNPRTNDIVFLNPISDKVEITVNQGYPDNIERRVKNTYNILNRDGLIIPADRSIVSRDNQTLSVYNVDETDGIYFARVTSSETEHVIILDDVTLFNDIIYDPVLSIRQDRLKVILTQTGNWFGKLEAPGYIIKDNTIIENFDNLTSSVKEYYNTESIIDNQGIESAARAYIGYQDREYFNSAGIIDEAQFNFYQGFVKEKGTMSPIQKALRSNVFRTASGTTIFEDWAIKKGTFGAAERSRYDVFIDPSQVSFKDQIVTINKSTTSSYSVSKIDIVIGNKIYNSLPVINILPNSEQTNFTGVAASAYAILGPGRKLERVVVTNSGSGYTLPPQVIIDDSDDILYANIAEEHTVDTDFDQFYNIDINDRRRVLSVFPYTKKFINVPMTLNDVSMPVAGYVNYNDIDYYFYNFEHLLEKEFINELKLNNIIWQASTYSNNWNVYRVINPGIKTVLNVDGNVAVNFITDISDSIMLCKEYNSPVIFIGDDLVPAYGKKTTNGYELYNFDGTRINDTHSNSFIFVLLSLRYSANSVEELTTPIFDDTDYEPGYGFSNIISTIKEITWIDDINRAVAVINASGGTVSSVDVLWSGSYEYEPKYRVLSLGTGLLLTTEIDNLGGLYNVQVTSGGSGYTSGEVVLFNNSTKKMWAVLKNNSVYRKQEMLVDTKLLKEAYLYEKNSYATVSRLTPFDPLKGIISGVADQNISFKSYSDPVDYQLQKSVPVGSVWLDLTSFKYCWYEQPSSTDETESDALLYRRRYWGKTVDGAVPAVYEWTKSYTSPAEFDISNGVPKEEFIESFEYNPLTSERTKVYYFWVKNKVSKPGLKNRNLSCLEISKIIQNGRNSGEPSYAVISATSEKDCFVIFGSTTQINSANVVFSFEVNNEKDKQHTQWELISVTNNTLPGYLVESYIDSLIGYTKEIDIAVSSESILLPNGKYVLPVPSNFLKEKDRYGLGTRPRQSMFANKFNARRECFYLLNEIFKLRPFLKDFPFITSMLYSFTNVSDWYESGYNSKNTKPNLQVDFLSSVNVADLDDGAIVQVNGTTLIEYYKKINNSLELIKVVNGTIRIVDPYTVESSYSAALRTFMEFIFNSVFINDLSIYKNQLLFSGIQYAVSEQPNINWIFKSSYINVSQQGVEVSSKSYITPSGIKNIADFINEAKPYHSKIRNFVYSIQSGLDIVPNNADDDIIFGIKAKFDRICNSINIIDCAEDNVVDAREFSFGWDTDKWDVDAWDSETLGDAIDAGMFGNNINDIIDSSLFNDPNVYKIPQEIYLYSVQESVVFNVTVI